MKDVRVMTEIIASAQDLEWAKKEIKTATTRSGIRWVEIGSPIPYISNDGSNQQITVYPTKLVYKKLKDLTPADAHEHGYVDLRQLFLDTCSIYPNLDMDDVLTIIHFEINADSQV